MIELGELAQLAGGRARGRATVTGITHDSRAVRPGDLYVAVPGTVRHGIEFAAEALRSGAVAIATDEFGAAALPEVPAIVLDDVRSGMAILAARVHGNPERDLEMLGVTGTNGKTTVAFMVRHILMAQGLRTGMIGTLGTWIDTEHVPGARTTPESTDLFATLARMRTAGVTHVVMEVSSHGLALHRVAGLNFRVAGFTNLTQDHLDFHGTMQEYYEAKRALFGMCQRAVVSVQDEWGERLAGEITDRVTVGPGGDVQIRNLRGSITAGVSFTLHGPGGDTDVSVPVIGDFNAANAAMAIAMAGQAGIEPSAAALALRDFTSVPGRLERVPVARGAAFVDYAHTPDAVERVLRVLAASGAHRVITVVGCGGDRDPGKRGPMGEVAARHSAVVIVTDDNPRSEDPATIRAAVLAGARHAPAQVHEVPDRREAIRLALSLAGGHDVVAVLGKGHESGQEAAGVVHPFDDREVVRQEGAHA